MCLPGIYRFESVQPLAACEVGLAATPLINSEESERTMHILGIILLGLVVGIIAKFLLPGDDPGGLIVTTLLGIAGAFLANYVGVRAGWYSEGEPAGFLASVVGAIAILLLYRLLFRRRAHR